MTDIALVTGAGGALGGEVARAHARARTARSCSSTRRGARAARGARGFARRRVRGARGHHPPRRHGPRRCRASTRELGGPPTVAALVAGAWRGGKPLHEETTDDVWRSMMGANLETVHRSLRALLPPMVAREAREHRRHRLACRRRPCDERARRGVRGVEGRGRGAGAAPSPPRCATPACASTPSCRAPWTRRPTAPRCPRPTRRAGSRSASAAGVVAFLLGDEARDVSGAALPVYGRA